jgi:hypothetical protein
MKDSDTEIKKSPALQKILNYPGPRREQENEEKKQPFDDARVRSRDNVVLELRFADGTRAALCYSYLVETDFEFGEGTDTITLRFNSAKVVVTGQGLLGLYEKLLDQRTRYIQEGMGSDDDTETEHAAYVERIEIERKED